MNRLSIISAISASGNRYFVQKRGYKINDIPEIPLVMDDKIQTIKKTSKIYSILCNMGLKEEYETTEFVERYQVSAILDSRTSDVCENLDGEVFTKNDARFTFPPYHYQCRTIVVPIVEGEQSELSAKNPQSYIQDGFGIDR